VGKKTTEYYNQRSYKIISSILIGQTKERGFSRYIKKKQKVSPFGNIRECNGTDGTGGWSNGTMKERRT